MSHNDAIEKVKRRYGLSEDVHDPIEYVRDAVRRIDALITRAEAFKADEAGENIWLDPLEGFAGWLQSLRDEAGEFPDEGAHISGEDLEHFDEAITKALDDRVDSLFELINDFEVWGKELRTWLHDTELEYDRKRRDG